MAVGTSQVPVVTWALPSPVRESLEHVQICARVWWTWEGRGDTQNKCWLL